MPIEIREMIIKATVEPDSESPQGNESAAIDKEQIVEECVQQVMEILERAKER